MNQDNLKMQWNSSKEGLDVYCSAVADSKGKVLVTSSIGKLLLFDLSSKKIKALGEMNLAGGEEIDIQSHPAFLGSKIFLRLEKEVVCIELNN